MFYLEKCGREGFGVKIWQVLVIRELDMIYIDCGSSNFKSLFTTWRLGLALNDFSSVGDNVTLGQLQHGSLFFFFFFCAPSAKKFPHDRWLMVLSMDVFHFAFRTDLKPSISDSINSIV